MSGVEEQWIGQKDVRGKDQIANRSIKGGS